MSRPIFSDFSPNISAKELRIALPFLIFPWRWRALTQGDASLAVEDNVKKFLNVPYAKSCDSGRTALLLALKALGVGEGDEVLIQGYTCLVVANAITYTGAHPRYIDIDSTDLNMDVDHIEDHITPKTKAIIAQHTFGHAASLDHIMNIASKHDIPVIEDCAHTVGSSYQGKKLGTIGDIGIYSFGSDKAITSIRGGALVTSRADLMQRVDMLHDRLPEPSRLKTVQHLMYIPLFLLAKPLYHVGIGKVLLKGARSLHILARIIYPEERIGKRPLFYPARLSHSLALILLEQLNHLTAMNKHRKRIEHIYREELPQLRFQPVGEDEYPLYMTALVSNPRAIQRRLKKKNIFLTLYWTGQPIVPAGVDLSVAQYRQGSCPIAEDLSTCMLSLPTHRGIRDEDARRISDEIRLCMK